MPETNAKERFESLTGREPRVFECYQCDRTVGEHEDESSEWFDVPGLPKRLCPEHGERFLNSISDD